MQISDIGMALQGSLQIATVGTIATNIALSSSLQLLWGIINSLQIIFLTTLFNVNIPSNARVMFSYLMSFSQMDLLPIELLSEKMFS